MASSSKILTLGSKGFVGDAVRSEDGINMMVGVLMWKADSSTTQQTTLLRVWVGREQLPSLVLGRSGTSQDRRRRPVTTRSVRISLERMLNVLAGEVRSIQGKVLFWAEITSWSTRQDQGCVVVCEYLGLVKRIVFFISVCVTYVLDLRFHWKTWFNPGLLESCRFPNAKLACCGINHDTLQAIGNDNESAIPTLLLTCKSSPATKGAKWFHISLVLHATCCLWICWHMGDHSCWVV